MPTDLEFHRYEGETETVVVYGGHRDEDSVRLRLGILSDYRVKMTTEYGMNSLFE